jgi:hypothetical protein
MHVLNCFALFVVGNKGCGHRQDSVPHYAKNRRKPQSGNWLGAVEITTILGRLPQNMNPAWLARLVDKSMHLASEWRKEFRERKQKYCRIRP